MTEVVHTLTGMKMAGPNDDGTRYYRKFEVDAYIERMVKNRFKPCGWIWQYLGDIHFSETKPEWATIHHVGDPIPFKVYLDREDKTVAYNLDTD